MPASQLTFCCNDHMMHYIGLCVIPSEYPFVSWTHHITKRVEVCSTCQWYLDVGVFAYVIDDVCREAFTNYAFMQDAVDNRLDVTNITPYNRYMLESHVVTSPFDFTIHYEILTSHLVNVIGKWVDLMQQNGMDISISSDDTWQYIYDILSTIPKENIVTNMGTLILEKLGNILSQFFEQYAPNAIYYVAQQSNKLEPSLCYLNDVTKELKCTGFYYPGLSVALVNLPPTNDSVIEDLTLGEDLQGDV